MVESSWEDWCDQTDVKIPTQNLHTLQKSLYAKILAASQVIHNKHNTAANHIIVSNQIANILKNLPDFLTEPK